MTSQGKSSKHVLALGIDHHLAEQMSLWLAMDGIRVIALGENSERLVRLKREVDDYKGQFDYFCVDFGQPQALESCLESLIYQFDGIDYIINFCDARNDNPAGHALQRLIPMYQTICRQYQGVRSLKRIVDIVLVSQPPSTREVSHAVDGVEQQHLFIVEADCSIPQLAHVPDISLAQLPVECLGQQVLKLLSKADAQTALIITQSNDEVWLQMLSPELGQPTKVTKSLPVVVYEGAVGRSVYAARSFKAGERVLKTFGQVLHHQTEHSIQIGPDLHLEPYGVVRLINHSCSPNLGVKTNSRGLPDFYAFQDIKVGDELTFDYAMTEFNHQPRLNPALEFDLTCRCGAPTCRGKLGYFSELSEAMKRHYAGFISQYLLEPSSAMTPVEYSVTSS